VVRKIQVSDTFKEEKLYDVEIMKEMIQIMMPPSKTAKADAEDVDSLDPPIPEISHDMDVFDANKYEEAKDKAAEWFDPNSKLTSVLSFDKQGRIVQSQLWLDMGINEPKKDGVHTDEVSGMRMKMSSTFNMTSIGQAKLVNPPTQDNTVDGIENLKGSLLGKLFDRKKKDDEDEETEVEDAAQAAEEVARPTRKSKKRR
jgi:hypothetical protein